MNKKVILEVESVYTAYAFKIEDETFIVAGSETTPQVFMHSLKSGTNTFIEQCPGGVMSFVPTPGHKNMFYSIMGLFPPFKGAEAGLFLSRIDEHNKWETTRVMHLPLAHRCDILNRDNKNYLFAASVSKHKDNPADWSQPGQVYQVNLNDKTGFPESTKLIDNSITRNHGMLKVDINGEKTLLVSGAEGIFYLDFLDNSRWALKEMFNREVSEFGLIDLDGDGQDELVTIEPFHGDSLNVYKRIGNQWKLKFTDSISFGHGLSCGMFGGEPVVVVGNRSGSLTLDLFKPLDFEKGQFSRQVIEEQAGPTQTQVFSANGIDYILSANQRDNQVALYW